MGRFIEFGLFEASESRIFCMSLAKRCDDFTAKALRKKPAQALDLPSVRQSPTKTDFVRLEVEIEKKKNTKKPKPSLELPSYISAEQWKEICEFKRAATKQPMSPRAQTLFLGELEKINRAGFTIEQVLNLWAMYPHWKTMTLEYMQNKYTDANFVKKLTQREYAEKTTMADRARDTSWADGL